MDYTIVGISRGGDVLLLVPAGSPPDAELDARTYDRSTRELSTVEPLARWTKFILFEDYAGPQDALAELVPDTVFGGRP